MNAHQMMIKEEKRQDIKDQDRQRRKGQLIAAAPEMLEALIAARVC